jgi:hypothetical protein
MIPLSAQSISLDSPFNIYNLFEKGVHYWKNSGSGIADQWQRCQRTTEKIAVAE